MISDVDIWRAALLMVKRYGDDAMLEAAALFGPRSNCRPMTGNGVLSVVL
jgi:hypothetical protein